MGEAPFWNKSIEQLLGELGATRQGLASLEAERRLLRYARVSGPGASVAPATVAGRAFARVPDGAADEVDGHETRTMPEFAAQEKSHSKA